MQDFLKTSHQAVYNLSLPVHMRNMQSADFQPRPDTVAKQESAAALVTGRTDQTEEDDDVDGTAW